MVKQIKNEFKETKERCCELQKNHSRLTVSSESISKNGVFSKGTGDPIYEVLSGRLVAVANEIISEVELSIDD